MENIIKKYNKKIDNKKIINIIEELKDEYLSDGFQITDIPPIISTLMLVVSKFNKLNGMQKKKLVINLLNYLIDEIYVGEKNTEIENFLKSMVPSIIDGFSSMYKINKSCLSILPCIKSNSK